MKIWACNTLFVLVTQLTISCAYDLTLNDSVHIAILGDFGLLSEKSSIKRHVIESLHEINKKNPFNLAIELGDNVYPYGVDRNDFSVLEKIFNKDFQETFFNFTFLMVLGNHDYYGDIETQILYSKVNHRWYMPNRFYSYGVFLKSMGIKVRFLVLDTTPIMEDAIYNAFGIIDQKQLDFIMKELDIHAKDSHYLFFLTHHSIIVSNGPHKSPPVGNVLADLSKHYNISAVISGHDHNLQFHEAGSASYISVNQAVIGSSAKLNYANKRNSNSFLYTSAGGFATLNITSNYFTITYYSELGVELFKKMIPSRI